MLNLDTKSVQFVPAWNGNRDEAEPIRMELARLSLEDYWRASSICIYLGNYAKANIEDLSAAKFAANEEVVREIAPLIKRYVSSLSGLCVNDQLAKPEDLTKTPQCVSLVFEILTELLRISTLDNALKKKSEELPPGENKTVI